MKTGSASVLIAEGVLSYRPLVLLGGNHGDYARRGASAGHHLVKFVAGLGIRSGLTE